VLDSGAEGPGVQIAAATAKLVTAFLRVARVTAGLAESNDALKLSPLSTCAGFMTHVTYLQADCQKPGSPPVPHARQSSMGYLYHFFDPLAHSTSSRGEGAAAAVQLASRFGQRSINAACVEVGLRNVGHLPPPRRTSPLRSSSPVPNSNPVTEYRDTCLDTVSSRVFHVSVWAQSRHLYVVSCLVLSCVVASHHVSRLLTLPLSVIANCLPCSETLAFYRM